ncbi:MAG: [FeFe] hydrogenase H-cluster radical SAM maturase HydE [Candidatus Izimaplasma sp.]|nr:[FeFe] hydrogenase H-cluster radical SAM maturase HydE [Candidatus Izimaplasma bacterium]
MNTILPYIKNKALTSEKVQNRVKELILELRVNKVLSAHHLLYILDHIDETSLEYLFKQASEAKQPFYGNNVYLRALIEISNYCNKGCFYCGISRHNNRVNRYRLTVEDILTSCDKAYELGYRTFVLQAGEDPRLTKETVVKLIQKIKQRHKDTRITLSLGEQDKATYQAWFDAGADRYLLRHETASKTLYKAIHSNDMSYENRRQCLYNLKAIGYQVGAGFMVGLPGQTNEHLVEDLIYLKQLNPHMVGIGPYLCHEDTKLKGNASGTLNETLVMLALVRLSLPKVLLPSTTALGTVDETGREQGLLAGANVFMPNVGPTEYKKDYEIYQNKICVTDTTETCYICVRGRISQYQHQVNFGVGDHVDIERMTSYDR